MGGGLLRFGMPSPVAHLPFPLHTHLPAGDPRAPPGAGVRDTTAAAAVAAAAAAAGVRVLTRCEHALPAAGGVAAVRGGGAGVLAGARSAAGKGAGPAAVGAPPSCSRSC